MDDLLHNFNKFMDDKREEIIEIANSKKKDNKKMTDTVDKLTHDVSKTLYRINAATEKKLKDSARYKKKEGLLLTSSNES